MVKLRVRGDELLRLEQVKEALISNNLDAFIISEPHNRYYVSNFTGSSGMVLVTLDAVYLITDFRYVDQASDEVYSGVEVVMQSGDITDKINDLLGNKRVKFVGFEDRDISFSAFRKLEMRLSNYKLVPKSNLIENLRLIKDDTEIEKIKRACEMGDAVFSHLLNVIRPGVSERYIAIELEKYLLERGLHTSFASIVASGTRGAMPHASVSDKVVEVGDFVTLDFGCIRNRYVSDMTRTIVVGTPDIRQREIYDLVYFAQKSAIASLKPGILARSVDAVAREIISDAGFSKNFGHGLGHGVGLEVHEAPTLSPAGGENVLKPGMVFSIEPGIYLTGWGGIRIEDLVVMKDTGPEILTRSPKELIQL